MIDGPVKPASGAQGTRKELRRRRPGDHEREHEQRRQGRPPPPRPVDEPGATEAEHDLDGHGDGDVDGGVLDGFPGRKVAQHLAVVAEPGEGDRVHVVPVEEAAHGLVQDGADRGEQQEGEGDGKYEQQSHSQHRPAARPVRPGRVKRRPPLIRAVFVGRGRASHRQDDVARVRAYVARSFERGRQVAGAP